MFSSGKKAAPEKLPAKIAFGESRLVRRFKRGDERAFARVYRRFHGPILNYVLQRVNDPHAAEEITQEVFLKAHRFRESFDARYALTTWLWTIARNTIIDWSRKHHHQRGASFPPGPADAGAPVQEAAWEQIASSDPCPETVMNAKHERRRLARLLGSLTDLQRKVLWMRLVQHLSYREISEKLGLSLAAVKCLVYRAKQMLAELGAQGFNLDGAFAEA